MSGDVRYVIEVDRSQHSGGIQLSIGEVDPDGGGSGYRLAGPKFCACHGSDHLLTHELDDRDVAELRRFLDRRNAARTGGPTDG